MFWVFTHIFVLFYCFLFILFWMTNEREKGLSERIETPETEGRQKRIVCLCVFFFLYRINNK